MSNEGGALIGKEASMLLIELNELGVGFSIGRGRLIVSESIYDKLLHKLGKELLDNQRVITQEQFQDLINDRT